jgi:hypothetical protein
LTSTAGHRLLADGLPVALHPPAVVGVLRLQALQVGGALGQLVGQRVARPAPPAVGPSVAAWGAAGGSDAAGARTSPVSGSIRRLSRMTGVSCSASSG